MKPPEIRPPGEAKLLHVDASLARKMLGWQPKWNLDKALRMTAEWYCAGTR